MTKQPIVFVDVETTGLSKSDRVVSIGIIKIDGHQAFYQDDLQANASYLIFNPCMPSHPRATKVHGFSDEELSHQDLFTTHSHELSKLLNDNNVIIAHNANFDQRFIKKELEIAGISPVEKPFLCTMKEYRKEHEGSASLKNIMKKLGLQRAGKIHNALEDAWLAMQIYCWLNDLPIPTPMTNNNIAPTNYKLKFREKIKHDTNQFEAYFIARNQNRLAQFTPPKTQEKITQEDTPQQLKGIKLTSQPKAQVITIEYQDSAGYRTHRAIELHAIYGDEIQTYLEAFCYLRNDKRTFVAQRIITIYDADGIEIADQQGFFLGVFGVDINPNNPKATEYGTWNSARINITHQALLLKLLAASDDDIHPEEIKETVEHCVQLAGQVSQKYLNLIPEIVKSVTATRETVAESLKYISKLSKNEKSFFLQGCANVIAADGKIDASETELLKVFKNELLN